MHAFSLALVVAMAVHTPSAATPVPFSILLERTETGWRAECAAGCRWKQVSLACETECAAVIDFAGITSDRTATRQSDGFAFVVERSAQGWTARSIAGTAWTTLGWGCGTGQCRARIDETCVFG